MPLRKETGTSRKNQVRNTKLNPQKKLPKNRKQYHRHKKKSPLLNRKQKKRPISKPILKPKPAVVDEESSILSDIDADDDFIPIEDLPSEKVELPTELFGKI